MLVVCLVISSKEEESTKSSAMKTTHKLLSIGMRFSSVQTASSPKAERQRRLMTDHNSTAAGECWLDIDIPTSGVQYNGHTNLRGEINTLLYLKNIRF